MSAAAETAARVFERYPGRLDAVVLGGDRMAIGRMRQDDRMRPYFDLAVERFLTVPEPRLAVLRDTPRLFRAVRIRLIEPAPPTAAGRWTAPGVGTASAACPGSRTGSAQTGPRADRARSRAGPRTARATQTVCWLARGPGRNAVAASPQATVE